MGRRKSGGVEKWAVNEVGDGLEMAWGVRPAMGALQLSAVGTTETVSYLNPSGEGFGCG